LKFWKGKGYECDVKNVFNLPSNKVFSRFLAERKTIRKRESLSFSSFTFLRRLSGN